jgi:hypothetical protein
MMTSTKTSWGTASTKKTLSERLVRLYGRFEDLVIQPIFYLAVLPPMYLWEQWHKWKERRR